jgi:hypothetical protein
MAPEAHITHRTANRLRIRIPSRKGDSEFFSRVQSVCLQRGDVDRVEVNPLTASVLIVASGGVEQVFDHVLAGGWFTLRESKPVAPRPLSHKLAQRFRAADSRVEQLTGGELDIPSMALIGFICAGIYQISIGNFAAPAWYTAFWYAANIAVKADSPGDSDDLLM